jgi:crossover junction endodeoxyribonuclease RuvC
MTTFVGVDPGKSGAVAILAPGAAARVLDTPTVNVGGARQEYDVAGMVAALRIVGDVFVAVEVQHAMPGQGRTSTLATGVGFGLWWGIVQALGHRLERVRAQAGQKSMLAGLPKGKGATKGNALIRARELFPGVELVPAGCKVPRDGRADALLIAEWARRAAA